MSHEMFLVTINVPPALEESMVDCLLGFETAHGFSSFPVNAHDHKNLGLSVAEQVAGRQSKIRFQMYIAHDQVATLLTQLKVEFSGTGLQFWVMPVLEYGNI